MASRRHQRRKKCLGKVRHDTEAAAKHAAWVGYQKGWTVRPYRCDCCGGWHVGHPPGTRHYQSATLRPRGSLEKWK